MRSTLFELFGIPIRSYGLMMVIGFAVGLWRALRVSGTKGIASERVYDLALILLVAGIVGSRVIYVLLNPETETWRGLIEVWNGGLSFHGGVAFACLAGWAYTRRTKLPFWRCADLVAPSVAVGYAITRIGCFLNGCCYGGPTHLPWGVRFLEGGTLTEPCHPAQIYAALANVLIFWGLTRLEKLEIPAGSVFISYLGFYGVYRFLIEFLRKGYSAKVLLMGLTEAQAVSILMIAGSAVALVLMKHNGGSSDNRPTR